MTERHRMPLPIVRVYTKPSCVQCEWTKRELTRYRIPYVVEDLTEPGNLEAAKALGHLSAPVVVVGDQEWAGFQPDRIKALAAVHGTGDAA